MKAVSAVLLMLMCTAVFAQDNNSTPASDTEQSPQSIAELVTSVREGTATRRAELERREQRFIEQREQRSSLLEEATTRREQEEAEADRLRLAYEQGERELADLATALDERSGDLAEVFTVVSQVAADAVPMVQNSMVSAQLGQRIPFLEELADTRTIPTAAQLRQLWLLFLDEMTLSGQVARYEVPIITATGEEQLRQVTRIGTFSALSDGEYLRFLPESGRLLALSRQPIGVDSANARAFEQGDEALARVAIDPSRGAILSLIVQRPELAERVQQGGMIGYIIIGIGLLGFALGIQRVLVVSLASRRFEQVLKNDRNDGNHAISQLQEIAKNKSFLNDADAMSVKMDEIVSIAAERLKRGLSTLAIFAAVSPLLGLLGTVTGMIETFQVITLFGAGDPRLMSGGISQALVTTQLGLAVAIPILLLHSYLQGRTNSLITRLDEIASDLFATGRAQESIHV